MIQKIKLGTVPGDKTGDPARLAGQKINDNFIYINDKISNKDAVTTYGTYVLVGQNLTIHAGWVWRINGSLYTNPVDVAISYPYSSAGKIRLDKVVFNTSNTFTKLSGAESVNNPIATPLPIDTIEFGVSLITENSVGEPTDPIIGDSFVKKIESQDFTFNSVTAVIDVINLIDERSSISVTGSVTDVKSVQVAAEFIRAGKPYFVKNRTNHSVKLWHLAGVGSVKYFFPNSQDLVIQPSEIAEFILNSTNLKLEYVGSNLATKQDISNQLEIGNNQSAQPSWHGKTVIFTSSCIITIPSILNDSFIFNGITLSGVTITWAITAPYTWLFGTPSVTPEKQIFTLTKRNSTNSILLLG